MKDIILVIALLLAVGLSVTVIRFAQKADKAGKSLEEERYSRMVAEETLQKNDAKLTTLQEELNDDQTKISQVADILSQQKTINLSLKKQYDQLSEAKANLESKLETVLQQKAAAVAALQTEAKAQGPTPVSAQSTAPVTTQTTATGH